MTYKILPLLLVFSVVVACKKKKVQKKPEVKTEVIVPKEEVKDTIPVEPIVEEIPEPIVEKPDNKYFLIAGSFEKMENAEKLQSKLIEQGFNSEVIVRSSGVNQEFYKVSYKGFSDKAEALSELRHERSMPNQENVWLLVKR